MAITTKKLSIYIMAGIVSAIVIIAAVFASGISLPANSNQNPQNSNQNPTGVLAIAIKDAPVDVSELWVTIDSIEVQSQGNAWTSLPFLGESQSVNFNLLALQDFSKDLSVTQLSAGNYSKIRLHVSSATATFADKTTTDLKVPSDKIDIIIKFEIQEGKTTSVLIDMTADHVAISNSHNLRPVLKATVTYSPNDQSTTNPTATPTTAPTENPSQTPATTPSETQETPTAPPTTASTSPASVAT